MTSERYRKLLDGLIRGYLFDLDGVLILSASSQRRAWTAWAARHDLDPEVFLAADGLSGEAKIRRFAPTLDAWRETQWITDFEVDDTADVVAVPGAMDMLTSGVSCGVVTSALARLAEARLRAAGLPVPSVLVAADDIGQQGKPAGEPYRRGAAELGIPAEECGGFEDTSIGLQSLRDAGIGVIVALTTSRPAEELTPADAVVSDLAEVVSDMKRWRHHRPG